MDWWVFLLSLVLGITTYGLYRLVAKLGGAP